jgi:hypothetical protein
MRIVRFFVDRGWILTAALLGTFLSEPLQGLRGGATFYLGWKKHFNFYGLNPKKISAEQANKRPILLLHGNYHNQSAWLALAKKLVRSKLGPVYTVNLPSGKLTIKDQQIINKKIEEIKAQYLVHGKHDIKIDIVGHSRGGQLAHLISFANWHIDDQGNYFEDGRCIRPDIGKVIRLGNILNSEHVSDIYARKMGDRFYEIVGRYDVLTREKSLLEAAHQLELDCSHVQLLYSHAVHRQILEWRSE